MANVLFFAPLALYLGAAVLVTITKRSKSSDSDYFFASKGLGSLQALLSVVSSETSVATTVVFPAAGFVGGYTLVWLLLGYITGRTIVGFFYLRALYTSSRLTIYQTMSGNHRVLEGAYLLAKYISGGARYFIAGYALQQLLGGSTAAWIVIIAICVGPYSLLGGLRAVVAMAQIQSALLVVTGIFLCGYLWLKIPHGAIAPPTFFEWDPKKYTFSPVLFLGGTVLTIGSHGADQDLLLRILSTRSFEAARRSLVLSGFVATGIISLYLTVGFFLRYATTAVLNAKSPLADYVVHNGEPLLKGVFLVLLATAATSSLDSTIHSTGAIWKSLMKSELVGRLWSGFSLVLMVAFAILFIEVEQHFPDFLSLCMGSMNYVNGGLIGIVTVFTFFPKRLSGLGVVAALIAGFTTTSICEYLSVPWTYTVVLSASASFVVCVFTGLGRSEKIGPTRTT